MKKLLLLFLLMIISHGLFSQVIEQEVVLKETIRDCWSFYKNGSDPALVFKSPKYSRDKRVYIETDEKTFQDVIKRAKNNLNNGVLAFTYNPFPFIDIVIPYVSEVRICYLPVSDIKQVIRITEQITGLRYDTESPDTHPEDGIYNLVSEPVLLEYDDESWYVGDECLIIVHEYFPKNIGGCSVEIRFMGIAY